MENVPSMSGRALQKASARSTGMPRHNGMHGGVPRDDYLLAILDAHIDLASTAQGRDQHPLDHVAIGHDPSPRRGKHHVELGWRTLALPLAHRGEPTPDEIEKLAALWWITAKGMRKSIEGANTAST